MLLCLHLLGCAHQLAALERTAALIDQPGLSATGKAVSSLNGGNSAAPVVYEGSWGKVGVRELTLEIPDANLAYSKELQTWRSGTLWEFYNNIATVTQILRDSGLNESDIATLTSAPCSEYRDGATILRPPDDVIIGMSPQTRARLYPRIGLPVRDNKFQNAVPFISGGFPRLAEVPSGLSPETIDLICRLSYAKRGGGLYFSDWKLVLSRAADDAERLRIIKSITREISLHASLELSEYTDRRAVLDYWGAGGRNQAGRTALEAILENREIRHLDLVHLLPPVAKRLINTYPEREEGLGDDMPDCFATAFSFFSNALPPRMLDGESVLEIHRERYERATAPWQFGDVLMIQSSQGQWIHACNFIAGEILFTKNGRSNNRPWVFQTTNDVLSSYLVDERIQAFFFRLKPEFRE